LWKKVKAYRYTADIKGDIMDERLFLKLWLKSYAAPVTPELMSWYEWARDNPEEWLEHERDMRELDKRIDAEEGVRLIDIPEEELTDDDREFIAALKKFPD
jgi:hypothetical protein